MYSRWESNPHSRKNWIMNPARLPIPPLEQVVNKSTNVLNYFILKSKNKSETKKIISTFVHQQQHNKKTTKCLQIN